VADTADAMASSVIALFKDPDRRRRLGSSARDNVRTHFAWADAAARIDALLRQ
jgi:glycosyltransferase involved in cell wall biosynthesis